MNIDIKIDPKTFNGEMMYKRLASNIFRLAKGVEAGNKEADVSLDPASVKELIDKAVKDLDRNKVPEALKLLRSIQKELSGAKKD